VGALRGRDRHHLAQAVPLPEDDLVSDEFTTIDGIARVLGRLRA